MKKYLLYFLLFAGYIALSLSFRWFDKHILMEGHPAIRWIIAIVIFIAAVGLFYFGKSVRPDKGWSRMTSALRCLAGIGGAMALGFLMRSSMSKDPAWMLTTLSMLSLFIWYFMQVQNKFKKEKVEHGK